MASCNVWLFHRNALINGVGNPVIQQSMTSFFKPASNQENYWLNAERLRAYSVIFILVYLVMAIFWVSQSENMVDVTKKPLGYDFITFYSASKLALGGNVLGVFDHDTIFRMEHEVISGHESLYPWNYPPQFLLVVLPLSLLSYTAAFFVWSFAGLAAFLFVAHRITPSPLTLFVAAAFPATMWNLTHGQNGFWTMALLGGALLLLDRRPIIAGILIGVMTFKPHLGILIPVALLFGRYWAAFISASVTAVLFAAASHLLVGTEGWSVFVNGLGSMSEYVEQGHAPWARMVSLFTGLRMLGVPIGLAYGFQFVAAIAVAVAVAVVWFRDTPFDMRAAVLAAGAPLATPYVFDYDLALLAIPIGLMALDGVRRGWLHGEREVMIVAFLTPLFATNLAAATGVHLGYLCTLALFLICVRRALAPEGALPKLPESALPKSPEGAPTTL